MFEVWLMNALRNIDRKAFRFDWQIARAGRL